LAVTCRPETICTTPDDWTRGATVAQVLTDDMPYLVDSVAAEFARDGVQVHRIVHRIVVVGRELTPTGNLQLPIQPGMDWGARESLPGRPAGHR
jgi:NAD-specific glutamate dehydrogenase